MNKQDERQQVIDYALKLNTTGLSPGKSGNISVRFNEGLLVTPSGVEYQQLSPSDIVNMDLSGNVSDDCVLQPSSEWHFHSDLYQSRADINAIVHTHSTYCTALACTGRSIPAFHYMVAIAGGKDIPIAPYALFGTEQLSENIVACLQSRQACLLANHGMIAMGSDLATAFKLAQEVEALAKQYCIALKLGNLNVLSDQEMIEVLDRFKHYGQRL